MVITLCGSTKFKDDFFKVAAQLSLNGHIVLMPCIFMHADNIELTAEQAIQLDNLHKQKINMSDAIIVINKGGYIGESTYGEIDWASKMGKQIDFLEEVQTEDTNTPVEEIKEQG